MQDHKSIYSIFVFMCCINVVCFISILLIMAPGPALSQGETQRKASEFSEDELQFLATGKLSGPE